MQNNVAILGPKGTFSDVALAQEQLRFPNDIMHAVYCQSIDTVFAAVGHSCGAGLVPIENTLDGYVQRTLDLLLETPVQVVRELSIPIQFSLIANTTKYSEIKTLYVQFKANGQCRKTILALQSQGADVVLTQSNMASFAQIEEQKQQGDAAIIPFHQQKNATATYRLNNVTDAKNNMTRFLHILPVTKKIAPLSDDVMYARVRVALYVMPCCDRPGILFELLRHLNEYKINLISIISRPTKKNMGTYNFYLEIDGPVAHKTQILFALKRIDPVFSSKILGIYFV